MLTENRPSGDRYCKRFSKNYRLKRKAAPRPRLRRDNKDFRAVRKALDAREFGCIFCNLPEDRVIASNGIVMSCHV
jgi:hypothetical protein